MKIRERVLNAAYQTYVDNKKALFVVGELLCGSPEAEGLEVEVNAVRGKPQPGPLRSADFLASCRVSGDRLIPSIFTPLSARASFHCKKSLKLL